MCNTHYLGSFTIFYVSSVDRVGLSCHEFYGEHALFAKHNLTKKIK
ncbi:TPA: hypothetical protein I7108_000184 [Vibrio cholerae O1]|uniref:Uncharacterized protein n=1 Tax=Vibrio cholerae serotype O1 (strain M66-2) TaxID=579112 RepID=C3LWJ6_VIBCM|nr:conserved hypothetical protein [Vibrio cholerae M66-2]ACP11788.1 conserved hypothetical protein [Vibrio cholerae O395]APF85118.1 hypothetical protein ASZ86_03744 [Vibrio cholerae]HAS6013834.1 hypothetical protein [Vibrio cholerae O1]